jgi:hypothetical protein
VDRKEFYLTRGASCHAAYAYMAQGVQIEAAPGTEGFVEQWKAWRDTVKPEFREIERMVSDTVLGVAGTMDALAVIDGVLYIIDYKASSDPLTPVQMAAYANMYAREVKRKPIPKGIEVVISEDKWSMNTVPLDRAWSRFMAMLTVYNMKREFGYV